MTKQNFSGRTLPKVTQYIAGALLIISASAVQAISIDGDLNDWIGAPAGTDADWSNTLRDSTRFVEEDQNSNYLNPGYGGQDYDVEAIYADRNANILDMAIVTGRAPGASGWAGGDISFNFNYAGGTTSFEYGIVTQNHDGMLKGQVYAVSEWNYGIWTAPAVHNTTDSSTFKSEHPVDIKTGTLLGTVDLIYTELLFDGVSPEKIGDFFGDHYVIEATLDLNMLALGDAFDDPFRIHWAPNCNNDYLQLDIPEESTSVPEPTSILLMLAGVVGLLGSRRRKT